MMDDELFNLSRFVDAQNDCYERVLEELGEGRKRTHWMWFIFPQFQGLGSSPTAEFFAIKSMAEAEAFIEHPVLGARFKNCVEKVMEHSSLSAKDIFGFPDYLKFHSSITLFLVVSPRNELLNKALEQFYAGKPDERTLELVRKK